VAGILSWAYCVRIKSEEIVAVRERRVREYEVTEMPCLTPA
jgi:hypothetical protein